MKQGWIWMMAAWGTALVSTLGALFIGEVMGMTPCVLCWWQRIFMFPLALILGMAAFAYFGRCWTLISVSPGQRERREMDTQFGTRGHAQCAASSRA